MESVIVDIIRKSYEQHGLAFSESDAAIEIKGEIVDICLVQGLDVSIETRFAIEDAVRWGCLALDGIEEVLVRSVSRFGGQCVSDCAEKDEQVAGSSSHCGGQVGDKAERVKKLKEGLKPIDGVKRVILVCSAKGGVGKSTVSLNLALAMSKLGFRVGLLDLDFYGPSLPRLIGSDLPPIVIGDKMIPNEIYGINVMSLGFVIAREQTLIWRGPMVSGVLKQFLRDTDWSGLDYLFIDMPPGTGDSYLSLLQEAPVDGAILVTTPSDLALEDVVRGVGLFKDFGIEVVGIVENMAYFKMPGVDKALEIVQGFKAVEGCSLDQIHALEDILNRSKHVKIFGNYTEQRSQHLGLPILGSIALDLEIQDSNDTGSPYMADESCQEQREVFMQIASKIREEFP